MVRYYPYSKSVKEIYNEINKKLQGEFGGRFLIKHIGSTAVEGLGGKGVVDVLISINNWQETKKLLSFLKNLGFPQIEKNKGRIFVAKKGESKPVDCHFHIVLKDSKEEKDVLKFRDLLRKDKKLQEQYVKIKKESIFKAKGNRAKYTEIKSRFINKTLNNKRI